MRFHAHNFERGGGGSELEAALAGIKRVDVLKIDCEGCEYGALLPFLGRLCVPQLLVEVHGCLTHSAETNGKLLRALATGSAARGRGAYGAFHSEPNLEHSDGSCIEFGLLRREACNWAGAARWS